MKFSVNLKANKAFKTFKILLIIILCITLGVSLLNYFNLYKIGPNYSEGFSSNEELANYDITQLDKEPSCLSGDANVPACYATVQPERGNDYLSHEDSEYILKTQIETPVCPNSPYEYGNGGFGSLLGDDTSIVTPEDSWLKRGAHDISFNIYNRNLTNITLTNNSTPSNIESPYTIQDDLASASAQNNNSGLNGLNLNYPTLSTPEPSTSTPNTTVNSEPSSVNDEKCPPCPACERCPEPVVECKKVVNYSNAANSGQLPVPYINDFSKF